MQWLSPIPGLIAAGIAVPLLVLMYFLKLRRREVIVSSTLLWKRAAQDLQVNAPFQRLRRNLLLLLQLLALAAALAAVARPVLSLKTGPGERYVLLIDRSASMSAREGAETRLDIAKRQARAFVGTLAGKVRLSLADQSDQAMVVAFDARAKVMCNFTSDHRQLIAAIDSIEPTDGGTSLADALSIAQAFAASAGPEANYRSARKPAQLVLFSDGRIGDSQDIASIGGDLSFHCVGRAAPNAAVVAMQARRSYERPEQVSVFATLANYGETEVACDVQLSLDGGVRAVRPVRIPPRSPVGRGGADQPKPPTAARPGKVSVSFELAHGGGGVLEVRLLHQDALTADDAAWAVLQPPQRIKVLLVSREGVLLGSALRSCPLAGLDVVKPEDFRKSPEAMILEGAYDIVVLDNCLPAPPAASQGATEPQPRLPRCRYIVFGPPPGELGIRSTAEKADQFIVDWQGRHPVLEHVNLENLLVSSYHRMSLPREAVVLAEFGDGPAMALVRREGSVFLLVGFDVMQTRWPLESGFAMFCYNAVSFLGAEAGAGERTALRVGQPITFQPAGGVAAQRGSGAPAAKISGPGVRNVAIAPDASGTFRYPATHRAGPYSLLIGDRTERFAVNLLDEAESDITPVGELTLGGEQVKAETAAARRANVELWPLLAMIALALVCLEWLVYNGKVRI